MILSGRSFGSGPSATFIHGFTQTSQSWETVATHLSAQLHCTLLDAPGHGQSVNGDRTLSQCGDDIAHSMPAGILVGYSMGARMALHTALQHPEHVTHLVLVSGTAGITSDPERKQRIDSDTAMASRIEAIGVPAFINEWLALPMFSGLTAETSQRAQRLTNTARGLADSLRYAGTGTQVPLWDQLGELRIPVLLIAGEKDTKFVTLSQQMHERIATSTLAIIKNAGHSVHLEATSDFVQRVAEWLYDNNAIAKPAP
jgi:2-succinyl-6-hydroxy-2,4-cyclohexadiene-1-carboxylate synthase